MWALAGRYDIFLEGMGGQVIADKLQFTLQTKQQVAFGSPMLVNDVSLGPCVVFPATACQDGTLALDVFSIGQFSPTAGTINYQ